MTSTDAFAAGLQHQHAGRLAEAEASYLQFLAQEPEHSAALHCLALVEFSSGKTEKALEHIQRAVQLQPNSPDIQQAHGIILATLGRLDEALEAFEKSIEIQPTSLAFRNAGIAWVKKGEFDQALRCARNAVALSPRDAEAHLVLGDVLAGQRKFRDAVAEYDAAVKLDPNHALAHDKIGNMLEELGDFPTAIAAHKHSISLRPSPSAWNNLGNACKKSGDVPQAVIAYQNALNLQPNLPDAHNNLGVCLADLQRWSQAIEEYRQAIGQREDYQEAHYNLANALAATNAFSEAIKHYERAIQISPNFSSASAHLASSYKDIGLMEQALAASRAALAGQPGNTLFHSNQLFLLRFVPGLTPKEIFEEHRRWDEKHARPLKSEIRLHPNDPNPQKKLRLGYVSPDFRSHSVSFFLENLLEFHNRDEFEIYCYSNTTRVDSVTDRLRGYCQHWCDITGMSDAAAAERIRADGIDLLIDLAGHTAGVRLLIFARKPAPVQVTYLGYPDTTGLSAIDYRLTDAVADPPGQTDGFNSEQLIRLPHAYASYRPPEEAPPVSPLPALANGFITFACFTIPAKLPDILLKTWAELLAQVPNSKLILVANGMNDDSFASRIRAPFLQKSISPDRLNFLNYQMSDKYLALHREADILLDTFPVNGHTPTCHALWMGLPVVTLAGNTCSQRLGASVLQSANLPKLIANSPEEYIRIASELAADLPALSAMRQSMRQKLRESPLLDGKQAAKDVEAANRKMWQDWCQRQALRR
jgi:predicted O-linked N-acetylglucosamine transferase (SPINDLY family)